MVKPGPFASARALYSPCALGPCAAIASPSGNPRRAMALALGAALVATLGIAPNARAGAPTVVPVTRAHPGAISDAAYGQHQAPLAVSHDGRFTAFRSDSRYLLAGYSPGTLFFARDVFLFDRLTNGVTLVSHRAGVPTQGGDDWSLAPAISADGRHVAFASYASDLVAGVTDPGDVDVFLFDRLTGTTKLLSAKAGSAATAAGGCRQSVWISADGSHVAFESEATDLVPGQSDVPNTVDVFLYDVAAGTLRLASRSVGGPATTTNRDAFLTDVSGDGRRVAFDSDSTNLVPGQLDTNGTDDVFVFDALAGDVTLVSHVPGLPYVAADDASTGGRLSGNGAHVAFTSDATNLVAGQTGGSFFATNVFVSSLSTGNATLVSHAATSPTTAANGRSEGPRIDAGGTAVAFESFASDLVAGSSFFGWNVYVFDEGSGVNTLVSAAPGPEGIGGTLTGLSGDGRYVAYESDGNPGFIDDNGTTDVFVYDRVAASPRLASSRAGSSGTTANGRSDQSRIAADGLHAAFLSEATDAVAGARDTNALPDVLANGGGSVLASRRDPAIAPTTAWRGGMGRGVSDDGRFVAFTSASTDIVPGFVPMNPFADNAFVFDRLTGVARLLSHPPGQPTMGTFASNVQLSGDGRFATIDTVEPLLPVPPNFHGQVYLSDRVTGALTLATHPPSAPATPANGSTTTFELSADGRFVLVMSRATDLVDGLVDMNGGDDLFVYDRLADTAILVTHTAGSATTTSSTPFNPFLFETPRLSADGRWVVYNHAGTDLVAGQVDTNQVSDVFLFDRLSGATALVSHTASSATTAANQGGEAASVSADGAWVAFLSRSTDLVAGQVDPFFTTDVFLFERATGMVRLVSHAAGSPATAADGGSSSAVVSQDGDFVAFDSNATNLVAGASDTNGTVDVFLYGRASDTSVLVSHAAGLAMTAANGRSFGPSVAADAGSVAYASDATDLLPGQIDPPSSLDAFRFARATGANALVSRKHGTSTTAAGGLLSFSVRLSASGAAVVFSSESPDLVAGDMNAVNDVFHFSSAHVKGDLNDDLHTDLVLRSLSQPVHRVWTMDGDANRIAEVDVAPDQTGLDWRLSGVDDFNADLKSDLVFRNLDSGAVEFWLMDGVVRPGAPVPLGGSPAPSLDWVLAATGDFSHDGQPDLVWRNSVTQQIHIWTMNGVSYTGTIVPSPSQAVDSNWIVVAALDLDVDGNTDFLWYNQTSGRIVRWLMDAQVQRIVGEFTSPMQAGDANWKVVAGGDYGMGPGGLPGTRDIVWRNDTSGRFVIWHMDTNGNRTSGRFTNPASPESPLAWTIAGPR